MSGLFLTGWLGLARRKLRHHELYTLVAHQTIKYMRIVARDGYQNLRCLTHAIMHVKLGIDVRTTNKLYGANLFSSDECLMLNPHV